MDSGLGGNIGYALVTTLLSRGIQIHRAHFAEHISDLSQTTLS